ncbi:hypothetical protein IAR55_000340 [Kwoniella newhampshirensis]|uniref:Serine aminopeptidase S33 domain-containing protein n=1 Tax=Kwoniella newhampshirensis TaxID=1651941 RepID=A0AAW0Z6C4_9TREE
MPLHNPFWEIIEPHLVSLGLYTVEDPTYGRWLLPPHPPHLTLINDPDVTHHYRRVFLPPYSAFKSKQEAYDSTQIIHAEDVKLVKEELETGVRLGGRWVFYSTWEMEHEPKGGWEGGGRGRGRDLVLIHGLSDYGLRYAPHVPYFLRCGFRVITPDLPSNDIAHGRNQRKVFLSGASMGGWTVLYYLLKYPPTSSPEVVVSQAAVADVEPPQEGWGKGYGQVERPRKDEKTRIQVAGAFVLCPMVEALCYHAWLRVGTGLALLEGMVELERRAEEINVPIRLVHGNADRATSHLGTLRLFDRLPNPDKEIEIYDGYEHIMLKVGSDQADDEKRQRVLADWKSWLLQRC